MLLILFIFVSSLIINTLAQFAFSPLAGFNSKIYSDGLIYSEIRDSGTHAYISMANGSSYKLQKWDVSNSSNPVNVGSYSYSSQTKIFSYVYFVNGYVIASGNLNKVRIFNESSYSYVGNLSTNDVIGRAQYLSKTGIFAYGTSSGSFAYFNATNLPTVTVTYLSPSYSDFVFMEASPDQAYVVTSGKTSNIIRFWRTSDWVLQTQTTGNSAGIYGLTWSANSRYCYVHLFNQGKIQVYDRNASFSKLYTIVTNQTNVRTSFYYQQTNVLVCLSQSTKSIFTVNLDHNTTIHYVYNFSGAFKMYPDAQRTSFTVCDGTSTSWFFTIYPYCSTNFTYNKTTISCDPVTITCPGNCSACNSSTFCTTCNANYNNANGTCISCSSGYYFNSATLTCSQCSTGCLNCSMPSICSLCSSSYQLVNSSCLAVPTGSYYNFTLWQFVVNCTTNCVTCNTSTSCLTCATNYNNVAGACINCSSGQYFNATIHSCQNCSSNCQSCTSSTSCSTCSTNYNNAGGVCITCATNLYFNNSMSSCQQCSVNCSACSNSTFCQTCEVNFNNANGSCIQCLSSQFFNNSLQQCQTCSTSCQACTNLTNCLSCSINFQLVSGVCLTSSNILTTNSQDTFFQIILSATLQNSLISMFNTVPGSRRLLKQLFGFFINLDHFWLYIYHKREYGYYVNTTLYAIKNLQDSKWQLISQQTLTKTFSFNISNLQNTFTGKQNYTSWKFIQVQKNQMSFFGNTLNYFILNIPLVLVMFFVLRFIFTLFFHYEFSVLFREYSFYAYILLMLTEGNTEQFSYLFISSMLSSFSFTFKDKIQLIMTTLFFFFFFFAILGSYFLFKSTYKKLTKYFYDNCQSLLVGAAYLTLINGIFNFCLGAAHRLFQDSYQLKILTLALVQICYLWTMASFIKKLKIFQLYYIQWANFIASFLRILLLVTYILDYNSPGEFYVIQQTQRNIIILYLMCWLLVMFLNYFYLTYRFVRYLLMKFQRMKKQQREKEYNKNKYRNMVKHSPNDKNKIYMEFIGGPQYEKRKKKSLKFQILCEDESVCQIPPSIRQRFKQKTKTQGQSDINSQNPVLFTTAKAKSKYKTKTNYKDRHSPLTLIIKNSQIQDFQSMQTRNFN